MIINNKSVFLELLGENNILKLIDFFIIHEEFDYTIKELKEIIKIDIKTLKEELKKLEEKDIIKIKNEKYSLKKSKTTKIIKEFYYNITKKKYIKC